ncbi:MULTISPECIES: enoyl-CoA hydratase-related protein [unclassified Pseudonocardia]|uniref:enoyl-CoA hydratase-related protein n=1 Tax=unclassified Pseudonocardia TaxID=2619320 RepID=UPI0001FFE69D|nr:enoyl-CoA hydratase-related protein [Pseudonocardia sp. Ae707_Ps1]OLM08953.1 Enoyl-CoA hydratase [Pseudonocardia sp. Ae707_Ps1]
MTAVDKGIGTQQDVVLTERRGHVLVVRMNRPRQRNALNFALRQGLREAFDLFDAAPELRCAVLTGEGPAFCAGGDLKEMAESALTIPPEEWGLLLGSRGRTVKPVIAAVNGFALAGGFRLAQDCDLCVAAEEATFGITEVKRGRGAPWAAPLISMLPKRIMMELLLTGEPVTARRAYEAGLVNAVVPGEDLLEAAVAMASTIAENAPLSVQAAKRTVELSTEVGQSQAVQSANWLYEHVYTSDDALEGPRAFTEKRAPVWTGR